MRSQLIMRGCRFESNRNCSGGLIALSSGRLSELLVTDNHHIGSAVRVNGHGDVTIYNATISGNSRMSHQSGLVHAGNGTTLQLENVELRGNTIARLRPCEFGGASIFLRSCNVSMTNVVLIGEQREGGDGGIRTESCHDMIVMRMYIEGFTRTPLEMYDSSADIHDVTCVGNKGKVGGCMKFDSSWISVSRSTFRENSATEDGGALSAIDGVTLSISACEFYNNTASDGDGGALMASGQTVVKDCNFTSNSAKACGAISSVGSCDIQNSSFAANAALTIGGAVCSQSETCRLNVTASQFNGNRGSITGGFEESIVIDARGWQPFVYAECSRSQDGVTTISSRTAAATVSNCSFVSDRVGMAGASVASVAPKLGNVTVRLTGQDYCGDPIAAPMHKVVLVRFFLLKGSDEHGGRHSICHKEPFTIVVITVSPDADASHFVGTANLTLSGTYEMELQLPCCTNTSTESQFTLEAGVLFHLSLCDVL